MCLTRTLHLLRKMAVYVGYTAPMVVLLLPIELPSIIAAMAASLALVWVAQVRFRPEPVAALSAPPLAPR